MLFRSMWLSAWVFPAAPEGALLPLQPDVNSAIATISAIQRMYGNRFLLHFHIIFFCSFRFGYGNSPKAGARGRTGGLACLDISAWHAAVSLLIQLYMAIGCQALNQPSQGDLPQWRFPKLWPLVRLCGDMPYGDGLAQDLHLLPQTSRIYHNPFQIVRQQHFL